jgi:hypothetical protein
MHFTVKTLTTALLVKSTTCRFVSKASLGGGNQTKMYSGMTGNGINDTYLWEELLNAEQDLDPRRAALKREVWVKLQAVMPYLTVMKWTSLGNPTITTDRQASVDFKAKFTAFMKAYHACWGVQATIHYHHMCWQHLPDEIERFGPPFLWSSSSMEKSHWKAHGNFHRHTQQGGHVGRNRMITDPLQQLMQFEVRQLLHRFRTKLFAALRARCVFKCMYVHISSHVISSKCCKLVVLHSKVYCQQI